MTSELNEVTPTGHTRDSGVGPQGSLMTLRHVASGRKS